jgi:F-type H+-transporting ATPase subunit delta
VRNVANEPVAIKYSTALFNVAVDSDINDDVLELLKVMQNAFVENIKLYQTFINPEIAKKTKLNIVSEILKGKKANELVLKFFELLFEKGRINIFDEIVKQYDLLNKEENGILDVKVYSAFELHNDTKKLIKDKLKEYYPGSKEVQLNIKVDEKLIGGIKLEMRGKIFDGSISGYLSKMKKTLRGE